VRIKDLEKKLETAKATKAKVARKA
jgi:hypothetical protein